MEIDKIYNENCLDTMSRMPDESVDLTVTSPPYDGLRDYNGYVFPFEEIARELYRVTKRGGWLFGLSMMRLLMEAKREHRLGRHYISKKSVLIYTTR